LPESRWQLFLRQDNSADGGIHATKDNRTLQFYCETPKELRKAIQEESYEVLLCGNARAHTVDRTRSLLKHLSWELFDLPPYSHHLTPSDYPMITVLQQ
jgi:hypothetical protein